MKKQVQQIFLQRAQVNTAVRRIALVLFFIAVMYGLTAIVYSTHVLYKVKLNYAVILEQFGGHREAITDVGWHCRLPIFTGLEKVVPLMNQNLYLGGSPEPMKIISR